MSKTLSDEQVKSEIMVLLTEQLEIALGALSDIGRGNDLTLEIAQKKARRIYREIDDRIGYLRR